MSVDLSSVTGLGSLVHREPSLIDLGTLKRSAGALPRKLLVACGFQGWELSVARLYKKDLSGEALERTLAELLERRKRSELA